jgi:hypothetical protein
MRKDVSINRLKNSAHNGTIEPGRIEAICFQNAQTAIR